MIRSLALVLALASIAGCKSDEANAKAPTTAKVQPASAGPDTRALCVELFTRNRACTSDYIPALVDSRARHDNPPGITEAVKADRNAVIAEAMKEWESDSSDLAIGATCDKISSELANARPDMIDGAKACLAKADCVAYTACITPLFEKRFAK